MGRHGLPSRWTLSLAIAFAISVLAQAATPGAVRAATTHTYSSGPISVPIPDQSAVVLDTPSFAPTGYVTKVRLRIRLNHTYDGDVRIGLRGPGGNTFYILSTQHGTDGDNYGAGSTDCNGTFTVFDDDAGTLISNGAPPFAGTFRPDTPLSELNDYPSDGVWTLLVQDRGEEDVGTIFCWQLEVTREAPTSPLPVNCNPRPRVGIATVWDAPGRVRITLQANNANNTIRKIEFQPIQGGLLDLPGGPTSVPGGLTFTPAHQQPTFTFSLRRDFQAFLASAAVTAHFKVTDGCGEWQTFAGMGTGVF